ncbi:hypothetical protein [Hyphomonas sp.]|uniref:hypothetical protein n=1 Tax=Hyphomonas sp. TaxID=87 RepID=UPI003918DF61
MKTAEQLRAQLAISQEELSEVQAAIAQALADGTDTRHLQTRRDRLDTKIRDLTPAIRIAEDREAAVEKKTQGLEAERLKRLARDSQERLFKAAADVDAAIEAMGRTYTDYRAVMLESKEAHRIAGSDLNAVDRAVQHSLRWALAKGARRLVDDSGMPRVPTHRETAFLDSVKRTTPRV